MGGPGPHQTGHHQLPDERAQVFRGVHRGGGLPGARGWVGAGDGARPRGRVVAGAARTRLGGVLPGQGSYHAERIRGGARTGPVHLKDTGRAAWQADWRGERGGAGFRLLVRVSYPKLPRATLCRPTSCMAYARGPEVGVICERRSRHCRMAHSRPNATERHGALRNATELCGRLP